MKAKAFSPELKSHAKQSRLRPSVFSLLLLPDKPTLLAFSSDLKNGFIWKASVAAIFALIYTLLFGNIRHELLPILLVAITINYFTGVIAQRGKPDSMYQGPMGIYRQAGLILVLIVGNLLETATKALDIPITLTIGSKAAASITDFFATYLLFQCFQDIVTNLDESGIPIPNPIKGFVRKGIDGDSSSDQDESSQPPQG